MEIIKIKPNMIFMLEIDGKMPHAEKSAILESWHSVMPNRQLLVVAKDSLKILEITHVQDDSGSTSSET